MTDALTPPVSTGLMNELVLRTQRAATGGESSVGVDVVDCAVVARLLSKRGDRLARRWYTVTERDFCGDDVERQATTVAGKEAVAKALGTGLRAGVRWTDIEILRKPTGQPYSRLHGRAAERANELGFDQVAISLGHESGVAYAVAIGLRGEVAP